MSKISLKELRMVISSMTNDLHKKKYLLAKNTSSIIQKNGEEEFLISNDFDFNKEMTEYEELADKLIVYKTLAQEANTTIKVEGKSLTEILQTLKVLRDKLSLYENLANEKPYKTRVDVSNSGTFYYEISTLRYDTEKIEENIEELRNRISKLEVALDKANTEPIIEIE